MTRWKTHYWAFGKERSFISNCTTHESARISTMLNIAILLNGHYCDGIGDTVPIKDPSVKLELSK